MNNDQKREIAWLKKLIQDEENKKPKSIIMTLVIFAVLAPSAFAGLPPTVSPGVVLLVMIPLILICMAFTVMEHNLVIKNLKARIKKIESEAKTKQIDQPKNETKDEITKLNDYLAQLKKDMNEKKGSK